MYTRKWGHLRLIVLAALLQVAAIAEPNVKLTRVDAPFYQNPCGSYQLVVKLDLSTPLTTDTVGWVIQHVTRRYNLLDCNWQSVSHSNGDRDYWEAWRVERKAIGWPNDPVQDPYAPEPYDHFYNESQGHGRQGALLERGGMKFFEKYPLPFPLPAEPYGQWTTHSMDNWGEPTTYTTPPSWTEENLAKHILRTSFACCSGTTSSSAVVTIIDGRVVGSIAPAKVSTTRVTGASITDIPMWTHMMPDDKGLQGVLLGALDRCGGRSIESLRKEVQSYARDNALSIDALCRVFILNRYMFNRTKLCREQ